MQYVFGMRGNWSRAWPEEEIHLLDCVFKGDESVSPGYFTVSTTIDAQEENEVRSKGKDRIKMACYLLELCLGGSATLNPNYFDLTRQDEVPSSYQEGHALVQLEIAIYARTPPSPEKLSFVGGVEEKVEASNWLKRAILWWGDGKKESDPVDRLIKLWIALECLGKNTAPPEALSNPKAREDAPKKGWFSYLKDRLNSKGEKQSLESIRTWRGKILHAAHWSPKEIQEKSQELQRYLELFLRESLQNP